MAERLTQFERTLIAALYRFGPLLSYDLGCYLCPNKYIRSGPSRGGPDGRAVAATFQASRVENKWGGVFRTGDRPATFDVSDLSTLSDDERAAVESEAERLAREYPKRPEPPTFADVMRSGE